MKEGKVTRKRIGRAINMLEHEGKLKSDEIGGRTVDVRAGN